MATRLRLIRHAEPAAVTGPAERDAGLSFQGARQAMALAARLDAAAPSRLVCSPMRRARETALPLACLGLELEVAAPYTEIPWGRAQSVAEREAELRRCVLMRWTNAPAHHRCWRSELLARALAETGDVVVVTHLFVINALVGAALGDERVMLFEPGHASITELSLDDGRLGVVALPP